MKRVLLQAGHVAPREHGFEPGTGTSGEQALVAAIQSKLGKLPAATAYYGAIMRYDSAVGGFNFARADAPTVAGEGIGIDQLFALASGDVVAFQITFEIS